MIRRFENYDLTGHNTFGMKVKCACFIEYDNAGDLDALPWESLPAPVISIGAGSNLLFTGDFPGTVLHSAIKYIKYVDMGLDEVPVAVGAGVRFDDLVANLCSNGMWGAENLSLIPGEVGAAAVQNIGAYGVEFKDLVKGVVCYDRKERKAVKFRVEECAYGYRDSLFKQEQGRYIVTSVLFRVRRNYSPKLEYKGVREALGLAGDGTPSGLTPSQVREAISEIRRKKLPDPAEIGSAGSFFKNPVVSASHFASIAEDGMPHFVLPGGFVKIPAAWLIERCGFKGAVQGGAAVYEKQSLVIVNASGNALPGDVLALEKRIRDGVKARFGMELEAEVVHI